MPSQGDLGRDLFAGQFSKAMVKARRKAGKKVGLKIVKERLSALSATSSGGTLSRRRRKAVRRVIGRDGTLVVLDHAPLAKIQETGGVITAKHRRMLIIDRRRLRKLNTATFVHNNAIFRAAKWVKHTPGAELQPKNKANEPVLIGYLADKIRIKRLPGHAQIRTIMERHADEYRDEIDKHLIEGME